MKKNLLLLLIVGMLSVGTICSQVGINTQSPLVGLHVVPFSTDGSTAEGIIAPNLTRAQLILKDGKYTASHKGAFVYITAIDGTITTKTAKITTTGYYYFDGVEWQPFTGNANNGLTMDAATVQLGGALTKATTIAKGANALNLTGTGAFNVAGNTTLSNHLFVSGKVGVNTTSPNANLDIRPNPTSTSNPGSSYLGIGTTTVAANAAGSGAIRYSTSSGGVLEYSNGVTWNTLTSTVQKSIIGAVKRTTQTFNTVTVTNVTDWVTEIDINGDFNASTGVFTAPRAGNYTVSFSYNFLTGAISAGGQVEAQLVTSSGKTKKAVLTFPAAGSAQAGSSMVFTFNLSAGETVRPLIYHSLGSTKSLRVSSSNDSNSGFVNFSVVEL